LSKGRILPDLARAIGDLDLEKTVTIVENATRAGISASEIIGKGVMKGAEIVGKRFEEKIYFLPELVMAGEIMKRVLERTKAEERGALKYSGVIVIGTVQGDLHDIGKNLVISMLIGAGFKVHDLGIDVPPERFIEKVKEVKPDVLGMSCLLTTTMPGLKGVLNELERTGLRSKVKVIVGGRPITENFARKIGADAYGEDAFDAVKKVRKLIGETSSLTTAGGSDYGR